jgi:hypothetical protein
MQFSGPLYSRRVPAPSGVPVVVGNRVVSNAPRRRKRVAPQQGLEAQRPHVEAPPPAPIPTPKNAIGAPKPKPPATLSELLDGVLAGEPHQTTAGTVVRK